MIEAVIIANILIFGGVGAVFVYGSEYASVLPVVNAHACRRLETVAPIEEARLQMDQEDRAQSPFSCFFGICHSSIPKRVFVRGWGKEVPLCVNWTVEVPYAKDVGKAIANSPANPKVLFDKEPTHWK
eukprot:2248760-Rhodomonas_salina.1